MSQKPKFAAIAFVLTIGLPGAANAAWQPAKPIEFIATAGPGGGTDNFARGFPENFSELIDGLAKPGDILVTKRQWGAFHGTELDLQLRRRGIQTIVLGGVATNIGVESTARQAWEHGYAVVLVEDATSGMSAEMHNFAIGNIFPRISRVVKSADLTLSQA